MRSVDDVRKQLRDLLGLAAHLDGLLAKAELPAFETTLAEAEALAIVGSLRALADRLSTCADRWATI